ncbi:MAG TPA: hypothetical protein VKE22_03580 [Haliangiales bacterium]|nr:hypothetical protein [Haliangiales bacterium]
MRRLILSAVLALGAATFGTTAANAEPPAQGDTTKAKDDFVRSAQDRLGQIDRRLAEIDRRADASAKTAANEVRAKRDSAQKMLREIEKARSEWTSMRGDLDRLLTEAEQALARIPGGAGDSPVKSPPMPK